MCGECGVLLMLSRLGVCDGIEIGPLWYVVLRWVFVLRML